MAVPGNDLPQDGPSDPTTVAPAPAPSTPETGDWRWVPIRSLAPRHRERIAAHLIGLPDTDRYLRFGYPATDTQISKYVDMLDFEHDEVFGIFNRRLVLVALAHLAHPGVEPNGHRQDIAEFGVSVLPRARGRGFGHRLFEHAVLHARNRGVQRLMVHTLSENNAMLRIAKSAGASVERDGPESQALLTLPPDSIGSHVGELVEGHAAEIDYRLKRGAVQVAGLLDVLADVKTQLAKATHIAEE